MTLATQTNQPATNDFAAMLDDYTREVPTQGAIMDGEVLRVSSDAIYFDVGAKQDAFVPSRELELFDDEFADNIKRGDHLPVYIEHIEVSDNLLAASLDKGIASRDWVTAAEKMHANEIVEAEVIGYNKGGVLARFGRINGFIPNSHIPELRYAENRQSYKARLIGETMNLKVIEVEQERERLLLSQRKAQKELRRDHLLTLAVGQIIEGRVVNLTDFGAFIDIGHGLTGLAHISKLSYERIDHPREAVTEGEIVSVMIDDIDVDRERVSLDRKETLPNPWAVFAENHQIGDRVEGVVVKVVDFGIFMRLDNGLEGMIHVSELPQWMANDPAAALREGDRVLAAILEIDLKEERMRLSLKTVGYEEEMNWMQTRTDIEA